MNGYDSAYPSNFVPERYNPEFGLTKRELFAARAMQGLLTNAGIVDCYDKIAGLAVNHADALIERLNADPVAGGE